MIDEALLRPGRLEVQVEISLPDEEGRIQILNIHTARMRQYKKISNDVDLKVSSSCEYVTKMACNRQLMIFSGISDSDEKFLGCGARRFGAGRASNGHEPAHQGSQ